MKVRHIFFDIGGVLGTNGWDSTQRATAIDRFALDRADFEVRHGEMVGPLESGEITLDEYLEVVVFHQPRDFSRDDFRSCMFSQSKADPRAISIARAVAARGDHWVMTLNNESDALNRHRIELFGLEDIFDAFLSSCWLGLRKPSHRFYDRALQIAQADPRQSIFIDDREHNITVARALGFHVIHFSSADKLLAELHAMNVATTLESAD
jgi:putative hydrolase of the HAD superfamily